MKFLFNVPFCTMVQSLQYDSKVTDLRETQNTNDNEIMRTAVGHDGAIQFDTGDSLLLAKERIKIKDGNEFPTQDEEPEDDEPEDERQPKVSETSILQIKEDPLKDNERKGKEQDASIQFHSSGQEAATEKTSPLQDQDLEIVDGDASLVGTSSEPAEPAKPSTIETVQSDADVKSSILQAREENVETSDATTDADTKCMSYGTENCTKNSKECKVEKVKTYEVTNPKEGPNKNIEKQMEKCLSIDTADKVKVDKSIHVVTYASETRCDSNICLDPSDTGNTKYKKGIVPVPDSTTCPKASDISDCTEVGCCVPSCDTFSCDKEEAGNENLQSKQTQNLILKAYPERIRHNCPRQKDDKDVDDFRKCMRVQCCRSVCFTETKKPTGVEIEDTVVQYHWPTLYSGESFTIDCWMRECKESTDQDGGTSSMIGQYGSISKLNNDKCNNKAIIRSTHYDPTTFGPGKQLAVSKVCEKDGDDWPEFQLTNSGFVEVSNLHENVCAKRKCTKTGWGDVEPLTDKSACKEKPLYTEAKKDTVTDNKTSTEDGATTRINITFITLLYIF